MIKKYIVPDTVMTVGELKSIIHDLDDSLPCGVTDHFGDFRGFNYVPQIESNLKVGESTRDRVAKALIFEAVDIGPEPD